LVPTDVVAELVGGSAVPARSRREGMRRRGSAGSMRKTGFAPDRVAASGV
jgi:hypothetical protein